MLRNKITHSFLLTLLVGFFCVSCARAGKRTFEIELTINVEFGEEKAKLTLSSAIIGHNDFKITFPEDIIPGDSILIQYDGEAYFNEKYPPDLMIEGEILGYEFGYNNSLTSYYFTDETQYDKFIKSMNIPYIINSKDLSYVNSLENFFDVLYIAPITQPVNIRSAFTKTNASIIDYVAYSFNPRQ